MDDDVIVTVGLFDLAGGVVQRYIERFLALRAARAQPLFQILTAGGRDEDAGDFAVLLHGLQTALHVDLQNQVVSLGKLFLYRTFEGSVAVLMHVRPLVKSALAHQFVKLLVRNKMVVHAFDFAGPGRARSAGHGKPHIRVPLHKLFGDHGFARARGSGDHEQKSSTLHRIIPPRFHSVRPVAASSVQNGYSTFCTCSRNFSISALPSMARRVISISCDLEAMVFTSRLNSCARKSSRRPAGAGSPVRARS